MNSLWQFLVEFFETLFAKPENIKTMPMNAPEIPTPIPAAPQSQISLLEKFCTAIRDFEGAPGDLNYQLNNPGDCRPSPSGYLSKYEPVEIIDTDTNQQYLYHRGKFAKFPTYELGWEYLLALVEEMAKSHSQWTILDFFSDYSPSSDGNQPSLYALFVARRCGVETDCLMSKIIS